MQKRRRCSSARHRCAVAYLWQMVILFCGLYSSSMHLRSMFEQKLVSTSIIPFGHSVACTVASEKDPPSVSAERDVASGAPASAICAGGNIPTVGTGAIGIGFACPHP